MTPARENPRRFDTVIIVDWSASSTRGPARESPDRCWAAAADARTGGDASAAAPTPRYFRTRLDCIAWLRDQLLAATGETFVGFDFPFGVLHCTTLPTGRALAAFLAARINDDPSGANNRFAVAAEINREIAAARGLPRGSGPFWGCPAAAACDDLTIKRPRPFAFDEFRAADRALLDRGRANRVPGVQSPFKLAGAGSVGSQMLTGLAAIDSLLTDGALADRITLWPFDDNDVSSAAANLITFAEVWPSLIDSTAHPHPIRDARQVATLAAAIAADLRLHTPPPLPAAAKSEGWIWGSWLEVAPAARR